MPQRFTTPAGLFARWRVIPTLICATLLLPRLVQAEDPSPGEAIYRAKCASCHGAAGEGTLKSYPNPLVGERSIGELTDYISKTMPEDKPGTCVGDEAKLVSEYIYGAFYSPTAQARNKPARIELSRLTVRQYRNTVADLVSQLRGPGQVENQPGLTGRYFKSREVRNNNDRVLERVDPVVAFNFEDKSPDEEKIDAHEFSIKWNGAVFAPDTGEYEFIIRTNHSTRLWINDQRRPLVDAYVKSGKDNEHRGSIFLLGGRTYALRLEFSKAKQGVNDKKAKERPPEPASISLEWKRPQRVEEVIPNRYLTTAHPTESLVLKTPFPPDDRSLGWEKATTISKEWDQATTDAAIEVADYVVGHLGDLAGARRGDDDRPAKLKAFCRRWAEIAFRRPLTEDLQKAYVDGPFDKVNDPELAVSRVVLLVLKSPRFLYREIGSPAESKNDPFDVASRLSYGLWDSMPDAPLLQAAAKGELATREQVVAQVQRMSKDLKAQAKLREFLMRWLKIERVPDLSKDAAQYPEFDAAIAHDLRSSVEIALDELLTSDGADFRQLLLSDSVYLNGRLAKFYGIDLPIDAGFQKVSLDSNERAGMMSHPYLLSDFAYSASSSPIHRGIFIARSVLGRTLRPPPEAVTPIPPHLAPDLTTRDRVSQQTKGEACQSCHSMINPLGFTLEHFDAVGRFRKDENGKPVDSTGSYRTRQGDTVQFDGVRDLAKFLAESQETHSAFVDHLFHAMVKQPIRAYGPQTKESLQKSFVSQNFNIRELLVESITASALTTVDANIQTAAKNDAGATAEK